MPRKISVPDFTTAQEGTKHYKRFCGLDYLGDETQISDSRSPRAVNVIADEGGFPERRCGWRTVLRFQDDSGKAESIAGIFTFENDQDDTYRTFLVHAANKLYEVKLDEEYNEVKDSRKVLLSDLQGTGRTQSFYMNGKLYLLTGSEYIVYDGEKAVRALDDNAYCPLTTYQRKPTGGGETYENVNMLSKWRRNRFVGDGVSTTYKLDVTGIDKDCKPTAAYLDGTALTISGYDAAQGTVTFSAAPTAPANAGISNVEVKFAKTTEDRKNILGCTIVAIYGMDGSSNRVFVSGNKNKAAQEWFSGLSDPTYFPDINYSVVGSSDFPIMCYLKAQGELLLIKRDNRQEGTIWHHSGTLLNDVATFPLKEGVPGYGAIAKYSAANLNDDPLYLSPRGVYAPTTTYYNNMQVRQLFCRSRRVNPKLCKESRLSDAVSAIWHGWYVLVIDGKAYVADGNQDKKDNGYEWYYWENVPARVLCTHEQTLYFGTSDGRVCKFNDDYVDEKNNVLTKAYNDDGAAIHAEWATKLDTMDTPMQLKTMPKRGSGVHLKSYNRSSAEVWIRTDTDLGEFKKLLHSDRFSFYNIDFSRFTFGTTHNNIIPFLMKKKGWKAFQTLLISDAVNEGFGVQDVIVRYFISKYAKR